MALDKNDLKRIRNIVREEVYDQITTEVPPIVEAKTFPIKQKVEQIWNSPNEDLMTLCRKKSAASFHPLNA
ncbi:MAG TPA: hypothetical protein VJK26_00800 [Patescibacteria group bacterium]|nr:hypothetical protein [Patescibacteria group bacterium]